MKLFPHIVLMTIALNTFALAGGTSVRTFDLNGRLLGTSVDGYSVDGKEYRMLTAHKVLDPRGNVKILPHGIYLLVPMDFAEDGTASVSGAPAFADVTATTLPVSAWDAGAIEVGDVSGDGLPDIVFSISGTNCDSILGGVPRLWIQSSNGTFLDATGNSIPVSAVTSTRDVELFDADRDGDLDIFLGGYACTEHSASARLLINNGAGVFREEAGFRLPPLSSGAYVVYAEPFMVDSGSSIDLVVNVYDRNFINPSDSLYQTILPEIWLNDGTGHFEQDTQGRLSEFSDYGFFNLTSFDADRDGLRDLLFANFSVFIASAQSPDGFDTLSGRTAFYMNTGDGYFVDQTESRMPEGRLRRSRDLILSDVENDGDTDILELGLYYGQNSPQLRLLLNDAGTGEFEPVAGGALSGLTGFMNDAEFGLMDEDSLQDLIILHVLPGQPAEDFLLTNQGGGVFIDYSTGLPSIIDFSVSCVLFDHQSDDDLDCLIANAAPIVDQKGQNLLYRNLLHNFPVRVDNEEISPDLGMAIAHFPNPVNGTITVRIFLGSSNDVTLEVLDLLGQRVATLQDGYLMPGAHERYWSPDGAASGIYFLRCTLDGVVHSISKLALAK